MATATKNLSEYDKTTIPNAKPFRFGIVVSEWNNQITENLYLGAAHVLIENGALPENVIRKNVPGSFELIYGCSQLQKDNFDAIIFPGGFGAAKNLCSFANEGATMSVIPEVLEVAKSFADSHKPAGYICIAPAIISRVYGSGVALTIGNDQETASALEEMGAHHKNCVVEDIIVDEAHKVVSTPAYMLSQTVSEAHEGISKLVNKVIQMV